MAPEPDRPPEPVLPPAPHEAATPPPLPFAPFGPLERDPLSAPPAPPRSAKRLAGFAAIAGLVALLALAVAIAAYGRPSSATGVAGATGSPGAGSLLASPGAPSAAATSEPYAFSLPAGWVDVDPTSAASQAALNEEAAANPALAGALAQATSGRGHYRIAVNRLTGDVIVSTTLPADGLTLAQIGQGLAAQMNVEPGVSAMSSPQPTQLPAGDALHLTISMSANKAGGGTYSVAESFYILLHGDTAVLVSFVTPAGGVPTQEAAIIDSLVVGPAAAAASPDAPAASELADGADVAGAFNATLTGGVWDAHLNATGEASIGGAHAQVSGMVDVSAGEVHTVLTVGREVLEEVATPSSTYATEDGVWFASAARDSSSVVGAAGFTDAGVEAHDGQNLHHMVLPAGVPVSATLVPMPSGATGGHATLEAWADDQGEPVEIDVTASWSEPGPKGTQAVTVSVALTASGPAQEFRVPAGDQVWTWSTSTTFDYAMAYPSTWEFTAGSAKAPDLYQGDDGSFLAAAAFPAQGGTLNDWASYARTHLAKWSNLSKPVFSKTTSLTLDGAPARQLTFHGTYNGVVKYHVDLLAIRAGMVYELTLSVPDGMTSADTQIWDAFLKTFAFK